MQRRLPLAVVLISLAAFTVFYPAPGLALAPAPLQVKAKSAVLMDVATGKILFEQNDNAPIEPASLTKIMTLYLVFENLHKGLIHLDDRVGISKKAWRTGGSKMFVEVNTEVPLVDLIKGILVDSGNDACVAVAQYMYGSVDACVAAMNHKAKQLGLDSTTFVNADGLPAPGEVTTARDMAVLDADFIRRFPEALKYSAMRSFTWSHIHQYNRNQLLFKDSSVDGLKTGYVAAAGYHLSATAKRDGLRLLALVMGTTSPAMRTREAAKLLHYGFHTYTLVHPFPPDKPVVTIKVWKGVGEALQLYAAHPVSILINRAQKDGLKWKTELPHEVTAPIHSRQTVGQAVLYVDGKVVRTVPLISHESIARAGIFRRIWHAVVRHRPASIDWALLASIVGILILLGLFISVLAGRRTSRRSRSMFRN